ncbi:MAG TPA: hypothetical protein DEP51_01765 [Clostridiales bacterium]|nr:hypothetical protein [Clostridiales bacterium]
MKNTIATHICQKNVFSSLNASSLDFDRFDYILRGAFYQGNTSYNTDFPSFTFEEVDIGSKKSIVPVYNIKDYNIIIELLSKRRDLYTGNLGYLSPEVILADSVFGEALNAILECLSKYPHAISNSFENLKEFIFSLSPKYSSQKINASLVNIEEVLKWDNISFINCLLDFAESLDEEKDSHTIELIALIVPPLESLIYMVSSMKYNDYQQIKKTDPEYIKERKLQDQELIKKLKSYIKSETYLAKCLKNKNFLFDNIRFIRDSDSNTYNADFNSSNIFFKKRTFQEYNKNEPIYVKLENGEICTIDKVPGKTFPFSSEKKEINYVYEIKPLSRCFRVINSTSNCKCFDFKITFA